jgi:hypothetical protein
VNGWYSLHLMLATQRLGPPFAANPPLHPMLVREMQVRNLAAGHHDDDDGDGDVMMILMRRRR